MASEQSQRQVKARLGLGRGRQSHDRFDYIIVGAGSAGSVLANRLSADQDEPRTVLLLEAGISDDDPVEAEAIRNPGLFETLWGSRVDWQYKTEPVAGLTDPQTGEAGRVVPWPRGKVVGGSSCINSMVYSRGNRLDYDGWEAEGNEGWGYDDLLPYFKRSEKNLRRGIGSAHGTRGEMVVDDLRPPNPISRVFVEAAAEAGYGKKEDFNDGIQEGGAGLYQVNVREGSRVSAASAFLTPEVRQRPNLTIRTRALARRLLLEGRTVVGVEYDEHTASGHHRRKAWAAREVILCGGTVNSPQLLMLSGIGPREHLEEVGVETIVDLPHVGRHLQDHPIVPVVYNYAEGKKSHEPPAAGCVEGGLFLRIREGAEAPDLQFHFTHKILLDQEGPEHALHGFMFVPTLIRPISRGHLLLQSTNPADPPRIQPNYLHDPSDLDVLVKGVKIARKIAQSAAFDDWRGAEAVPGPEVNTDAKIKKYIRSVSIGLFHSVGTCRMGSSADNSVVDRELRVHHVRNLRIADASVMPVITRGNTNAPTTMIAEKAADLILGRESPEEPSPGEEPGTVEFAVENTAQAYLRLLGHLGVEYFFATAGSDAPSLIDAFSYFQQQGTPGVPKPFVVPHEMCAVSLAHGYYLRSGKPPVVFVHSTVGTANASCGLINASCANVPLILTAGRTPITETGSPASRDLIIQWAQESFDQGGMVRNFVKWDYELRTFDQLETVLRRAFSMAMTEPRGPVYLTLPRELLAEKHDRLLVHDRGDEEERNRLTPVARSYPDPSAVRKAARRLARASRPLIVTRSFGRTVAAFEALRELAEEFTFPVIEFQIADCVNLSSTSPMHLGFDYADVRDPTKLDPVAKELLTEADVVVVLECPMPWPPGRLQPPMDAYLIHIGNDPLHGRYPIWGFPADLAIVADPVETVRHLIRDLRESGQSQEQIEERRRHLKLQREKQREGWQEALQGAESQPTCSFAWVTECLRRLLAEDGGEDVVVVQEYDLQLPFAGFHRPGSYVGFSPSGGLGFGMGGALGVRLAEQSDCTVISVVGDGTYLLGAPSACHLTSAMHDLPVLWVVCNNAGWAYLAFETMVVHPPPDGHGKPPGPFPLCGFERPDDYPADRIWPAYERLVEAFGGRGAAVRRPHELPQVLERGLEFVRRERKQYLINVDCGKQPFPF